MDQTTNREDHTMTRKTSRFGQAPAIVIAIVALFAAISGTAAALPGTQTVNSGDIKNNNVKSIDLKDGAAVAGADVVDESLTGLDVQDSSLTGTDIQDTTVDSADVKNQSLLGADIEDNAVTGADVAEVTLGQVPDAAKLDGKSKTDFISSSVYKKESLIPLQGTDLGDGTFVRSLACDAGDMLLVGGPANVNANSDLVESFPAPGTTNGWQARIHANAATDNWSVVLLCADM